MWSLAASVLHGACIWDSSMHRALSQYVTRSYCWKILHWMALPWHATVYPAVVSGHLSCFYFSTRVNKSCCEYLCSSLYVFLEMQSLCRHMFSFLGMQLLGHMISCMFNFFFKAAKLFWTVEPFYVPTHSVREVPTSLFPCPSFWL